MIEGRVVNELRRVEQVSGVRVLMAVESGSRAWGFASPDSDYDIRFVYVHERNWYVSLEEPQDVIEAMLPGDLDVSGWDLRKALRLFGKCNLAFNEWIGSPIVYFEVPPFRAELAALIPSYFNRIAGLHHYRSMAIRTLEENLENARIGIKKLFYVLRPLLACRWIASKRSQPPTAFQELMAGDLVSAEERLWIDDLVRLKADAAEAKLVVLDESTANRYRQELEGYKAATATRAAKQKHGSRGDLDLLLRRWIDGNVVAAAT